MTKQIIVIGRGHSGTRIPAQTLAEAGCFTGQVNVSYDHMPPQAMYNAVTMFGRRVKYLGDYQWDYSKALETIPDEFRSWVKDYLQEFEGQALYSWKLPETILALPWIVQMFPDAHYIHWIRDGRDNISSSHNTDNLQWLHIPYPDTEDVLERRAISWLYQEALVDVAEKPKRWIDIKYEDFIMKQAKVVRRLERFLDMALPMIHVRRDRIGVHRFYDLSSVLHIIEPMLEARGYVQPVATLNYFEGG